MNPNVSAARVRASLLAFLAFPLGLYSLGAFATSSVNDPSNPKTVGPNDALDNWIVTNGGTLFVNGGTTRDIMVDLGGILSMSNGVVKAATSPTVGAVTLQNNSMGTITGSQITNTSGRALSLTVTGTNGLVFPSATVSRSQLTGASDGVFMSGGGTLRIDGQSVVDGLGTAGGAALGYGMILNNGQVTVAEGSLIRGKRSGVVVSNATRSAAEDKGRGLVADGSSIVGLGGPGILVDTQSGTKIATVNIQLVNGASVSGSNGIAVQTGTKGATDLTIDKSDIVGNMVSTGGHFDIVMQNAASVTGAMTGIGALGMGGESTWRVTGNSTVSSVALDGSTIDFQPLASGYGRLDVAGNVISNNGRLVMNVNLDTVGPEAQQQKNFVGIGGDLTGALGVIVRPEGKGGVTTDLNGNGIIDPDEGFALVGVKGNSGPGSVYLAQPLVVAGLSYGIAASDGSDLGYKTKYSLGVRSCTESGCEPPVIPPVDPPVTPPVNPPVTPEPPDVTRPEVGSDVPVYLSLANAMFATNRLLADGWRQREGYSAVGGDGTSWGGNVFVNYINTQQTYSTNRSFQNYGYDADWDIKLAQFGGNLGAWASDGGTLSAFWMLSHGNVRVAPRAVDGQGSANLDLNSFGAGLRYESDRHWWVEGLVSGGRFNGDISTDTGGQYAGRVHASSTTASVESGWSFAIGPRWTLEPTLQVIYQQLSFRDFTADAFGDAVSLGRSAETSYRAGLRANWAVTDRTMLTARVAATRSVDSTRPLQVTNDTWDLSNRFGVGRSGNNVLLGVGANSQLTRALNVSAEGAWQSDVGASGARGWSGRVVARYSF